MTNEQIASSLESAAKALRAEPPSQPANSNSAISRQVISDRVAYSIDEAAATVGLSAKTLRRAHAAGELRMRFVTSKPVILRTDLVSWIESAPTERPS